MGSHRARRHETVAHAHANAHGHGHGHGHGSDVALEVTALPRAILFAVLGAVAIAVVVGAVILWPDGAKGGALKGSVAFAAEGVTFPHAEVDLVEPACPRSGPDVAPDQVPQCGQIGATVIEGEDKGDSVTLDVPPDVSRAGLQKGDQLELIRTPPSADQPASLAYFGIKRTAPLWLLTGMFALVTVAVARFRGLMAIAGLGVAAVILGGFAVAAWLAGEPAVPVALVASSAIMYVVLYTTHGFSVRTSAALAGTLAGMGITAALGWWAVGDARLTGVAGEGGQILTTLGGHISLQDLLVAAVIIAGLGVLNDVTITQASAVWELRAAAPRLSRAHLFSSAMRIGRDHIASTIYTIVFAYAGTSVTLLLAVSLYDRSWLSLVGTEEIAEELVRAFTSSIGLVLAVPATTIIAVLTVPGPADRWRSAGGPT
jgi:uncharacterized membrane protein